MSNTSSYKLTKASSNLGWQPCRVPEFWRVFKSTGEYSCLVHVERMKALIKSIESKALTNSSLQSELEMLRAENCRLKEAGNSSTASTTTTSSTPVQPIRTKFIE